MADDRIGPQGYEEDPSLDDLLRAADEELNGGETQEGGYGEEPQQETGWKTPATQDDFEPDFGNAFDDYGDYEQPQPGEPEPPKHLKRMRFPVFLKVLIYLCVVAVLGIVLATVGWRLADDVLALTRPDEDVVVSIEESDDLDSISAKLKDVGAIEYEWLFKLYCKVTKSENYFDPGVYTINLTYDYHALVNYLMATQGDRESVTVMIIEGADCYDIFDLLEENGVCSRKALEQAAANYEFDYDFLKGLPYGETNRLEGYLFPDTYEFYLNDEPENVINKFLRNFDNKMDEEVMAAVEASGYSLHEIITMASIVEGEAANDEERPNVASVMFNRLNNWDNPLLGMDSTVFYGAMLEGTSFSVELDSPYNTYLYPGLPEGPINNPGMNSIRAVLYPKETDYYYFATATDGLNRFFADNDSFTAFLNSDEYEPITP